MTAEGGKILQQKVDRARRSMTAEGGCSWQNTTEGRQNQLVNDSRGWVQLAEYNRR